MLKIRAQLGDFERIPRALEDLREDLDNFEPFFKKHFVPQYLADVNENIDSEGGLVGGWAELSLDYAEWKRKQYRAFKPIGVLTGRLKRSLSPKGRARETILEYGKKQARVGTQVEYAPYFNQERRILLAPKDLDQKKYNKLLIDYMLSILAKRKLKDGRR